MKRFMAGMCSGKLIIWKSSFLHGNGAALKLPWPASRDVVADSSWLNK